MNYQAEEARQEEKKSKKKKCKKEKNKKEIKHAGMEDAEVFHTRILHAQGDCRGMAYVPKKERKYKLVVIFPATC